MYSFRPTKFQYLEEFQCIPLLHSSGAGKKQSRINYQQPGNASQQSLFLCWWWLSTDFLASALHPTAIAGKPKCQLVLVFGGSWKAEKPRRRSRDWVFAVKAWVRAWLQKKNTLGACGTCQPRACHVQSAWVQAGIWWVHWPVLDLVFILCLFKYASISNTVTICLNDIRHWYKC